MKKGALIFGLALIVAGVAYWFLSPSLLQAEVEKEEVVEECIDLDEPIEVYGINVDTLGVSTGKVERNQTLSIILEDYGVGYRTVYELVQKARDVFNVRKIKAGDPFVVVHTKGENPKAQQFILEPNDREYVIYHLGDTVYAELKQREVDLKVKEFSGEITSSVYLTAVGNGGSPQLVHRLVDVFAWQVDFFRIQKGDKFKVIYEQEQVDGKEVGIKRILGAYFEHFGKEHYAIFFDECGGMDYYDECGNSVRRAFMKAPLNYSRISSRYSPRRFHPVLKRYKAHLGTDYAAPTGTPIRTVGDGIVTEAQYKGGNGNYVKIRHNSTYSTQYLHMSKIASGIRPGKAVSQGETIGYVGSTGLATGPHLCFRFWKNGVQVDALKVDLPPAKPVDPSGFEEFAARRDEIVERLDAIKVNKPTLLAEVE
jgi:murein DD-endopeptidase MepM/ murein hydrolase activator NlpD